MTEFEYEITMALSQKVLNGEPTECTEYQNSAKWNEVNNNDT